jgi:hypothetical protein
MVGIASPSGPAAFDFAQARKPDTEHFKSG